MDMEVLLRGAEFAAAFTGTFLLLIWAENRWDKRNRDKR